jgi:hypothetical protein
MQKVRPYQVAGRPVVLGPAFPHPRLGETLDFLRRLSNGITERRGDPRILVHCVQQRHALGRVEVEVVADRAASLLPQCQIVVRMRVQVLRQRGEGVAFHGRVAVLKQTQSLVAAALPTAAVVAAMPRFRPAIPAAGSPPHYAQIDAQ